MIKLPNLNIEGSQISGNMFIKILNLLPNPDAIRIISLPSPEELFSLNENTNNFYLFLNNNNITKLTLRNIDGIEQIYFVMDLFPRIQYFALQCVSNDDIELIIRCILWKTKMNDICHPTILCVNVIEAQNGKVERLRYMIESEYLLKDYRIYRQYDRFYLQWK